VLASLPRLTTGGLIGFAIIVVYCLSAVLADQLAPYGEFEIIGSPYAQDAGAGLGTDNLGRDMVSRLIYGARNSLGIAIVTTLLAFIAGGVAGFLSASVGGLFDNLLGRLVDVLLAMPFLIFALLLLTIFGTSTLNLVLIMAALEFPRVFRVARAVALNIVVLEFVEAARVRGEGQFWIITREVLPNAMPPLLAEFGLRFTFVFLTIAGLSFLGLGVQPPQAVWGSMVRETATMISFGGLTPLYPALAIAVMTVGVNLVVDWIQHGSSGMRN